MEKIENLKFDEERILYNLKDTEVLNCNFAGEKDGESVLKEARNIIVKNCNFSFRYPLWHNKKFTLENSKLDEFSRAPIWYSTDGYIKNSKINSIKCLRECKDIRVENSDIVSQEFGWKCENIFLKHSKY